jgi:membrane protein
MRGSMVQEGHFGTVFLTQPAMLRSLTLLPSTLKKALKLLRRNDPLVLSASTAFFTTFAISPILIILTDLLGLFVDPEGIHRELFSTMSAVLGEETANDFHTIVDGFRSTQTNVWLTVATTLFFYFVATTMLGNIKQSIQKLWQIRRKSDKKVVYSIKGRLTEVGLLLSLAVLAVISYFLDNFLQSLDRESTLVVLTEAGHSLVVAIVWFILILKFLPEATVAWRTGLIGGLFTGILFTVGQFLLGKIFLPWKVAEIFGVSGSMALTLLFVFYCSFVLYLGAAFTLEYAKSIRMPIHPGKYAVEYVEKVTEKGA